jgi:6-phosphofructokinase 1
LIGCQNINAKQVGFNRIAQKLNDFKIEGLLVIGDFEAYNSVIQLTEERQNYNSLCIPIICVPATISNNIPGCEFSIGSDTALNEIVSVGVIFFK